MGRLKKSLAWFAWCLVALMLVGSGCLHVSLREDVTFGRGDLRLAGSLTP